MSKYGPKKRKIKKGEVCEMSDCTKLADYTVYMSKQDTVMVYCSHCSDIALDTDHPEIGVDCPNCDCRIPVVIKGWLNRQRADIVMSLKVWINKTGSSNRYRSDDSIEDIPWNRLEGVLKAASMIEANTFEDNTTFENDTFESLSSIPIALTK